ncbi:MAG: Tat pathway signal sequence domain protein [Sphingomonas sp.]|nr:Tat pathway signal sequence domain protein [Sphingomonas sp.]
MGVALSACTSLPNPAPGVASLDDWRIEAESPQAHVRLIDGSIDIDTPKGLTLWWRRPVTAPVIISFDAMAMSGPGANDQVSDLNAFWMATNRDGSSVLTTPRSGAFATYDDMRAYYVGIGGNRNSTTRFRRYIGEPGNRPLLPQHDRSAAADMLVPDRWTHIRLIADGSTIAVERDGKGLFSLNDPAPYTHGHWGVRTTWSHLRIRNVSVVQGEAVTGERK